MSKNITCHHAARYLLYGITAIIVVAAVSIPFGSEALGADNGQPPNIVLVFIDDQGYQDLGCFGSPDIKTPNLDKMAEEGMKFTDFYCGAPVCSASRAALMTGSYCARVSVTGVYFPNAKNGLNPEEQTIADVLKQKNYATACIGKWHLGHLPTFLPTNQGFDSYYGIPYSNDMAVDPKMAVSKDIVWREGMSEEKMRKEKPKRNWVPLLRNEEVIEYPTDQALLTKRYTEEGVKFIKANKDKPFFLYMPHTMPHVPLFASEQFKGKSARGLYGDTIEEIDWSVGQILKTLKEVGVDDNTLVVYTSDNGPWLSKGKAGGCALPLRSGKFTVYEGGMRMPCIMRWPGHIPAGTTCDQVAATMDLLPTFAALAGCKVPDDRVIDGRSIVPLMEGKPGAKSPHEAFFYRGKAVRAGKWKLIQGGGKRPKKGQKPTGPNAQLYDLSTDISEKNDVAEKNPEVAERLMALLKEHNEEIKANKRPVGTLKKK